MASSDSIMKSSPPDARTLGPLPISIHHGLLAVLVFAFLSLTTTTILTFHLISCLIRHKRCRPHARPTQYLVLLLNLALADVQQSLGFVLNLQWLHHNSIIALSKTCWTQGFFINAGDVGVAAFTLAIACHLFADIVFNYHLGNIPFLLTTICLWVFTLFVSTVGLIIHPNDFTMRAGMWCWINEKYMDERLWFHYVWVLLTELGVFVIYTLMFVVLWRRIRHFFYISSNHQHQAECAAKSVILYPGIYVLCTLPAAIARLKMMTGRKVGAKELTVMGVMMTSNGWLDCLAYTITRSKLIFGGERGQEDLHGLDTFTSWQRYPDVEEMGNWIGKSPQARTTPIEIRAEIRQSSMSRNESTEKLFRGNWHVEEGRMVDPEREPSQASNTMRSVKSESDLRSTSSMPVRFPRRRDPCRKLRERSMQPPQGLGISDSSETATATTSSSSQAGQSDTAREDRDELRIEPCAPVRNRPRSPPGPKAGKSRCSSLEPKSPGWA